MDFSSILQFRFKKVWWADVILYFVISLLAAAVICYIIFLVKNSLQRQEIQAQISKLEEVGTDQQKGEENQVLMYQKKIADYAGLLKNHQFASNLFAFMEAKTMPDVWYNRFSLDRKNAVVNLSGESDNQEAFSRQLAIFEKDKYVKSLGSVNSKLEETGKIGFNFTVTFDPKIFNYISDHGD